MKKRVLLISILIIVALVSGFIGNQAIKHYRTTMPHNHIFVCDNPTHNSDFDNWLRETVGIDWVPTYMICRDGYVIGTIRGGISEKMFTSQLGTILAQNDRILEVTNIPIYDLDNNVGNLRDITGSGVYIVEISWIDCSDCQYQDENFTDDIYLAYSTNQIYRYYIHSERGAVEEHYGIVR